MSEQSNTKSNPCKAKNKILNKSKIRYLRISTLAISIAFIVIGIIRKEHLEVFKKAINICLECIGIG